MRIIYIFFIFFSTSIPLISKDVLDLDQIKKELIQIRELKFKHDVPNAIQSQEGFRKMLKEEIDKSFPVNKQKFIIEGLLKFGLIKKKIDLGENFINALVSQAAAYYDPKLKKFFYLKMDMPLDSLRPIAAHELVHALQDQYFDLGDLFAKYESPEDTIRNEDGLLALRYLIEGEATFVQTVWQIKQMMNIDLLEEPVRNKAMFETMANMDLKQLINMSKMMLYTLKPDSDMAKGIKEMETIPHYIMKPLLSAYMGGSGFVSHLFRKGGWYTVNKAFSNPPISSEQAIHPEKYTTDIDVPSQILAETFSPLKNWKKVDSSILGEFYLRIFLDNFTDNLDENKISTHGWDGDLLHVYENKEGGYGIVLFSTWDTKKDAMEFFLSYKKALKVKYPNSVSIIETDYELILNNKNHFIRIKLNGREINCFDGFSGDELRILEREANEVKVIHID